MMKELENISAKSPFRVPDGYFEEVNKKIISSTSGKASEAKRYGIRSLRSIMLAAASIAGFIILSYSAVRLIAEHRSNHQASSLLPEEEFSQYLNDLDIFSIEENAGPVDFHAEGPDASTAEIMDYLVLENIEINDIYELL